MQTSRFLGAVGIACLLLAPPAAGEAAVPPETPVVLVPGVTGVKLRDRPSGKVVWGRGVDLLHPHDGGYAMARPLEPAPGAPRIEGFEVIRTIRLAGVIRKEIYRPLALRMEAAGYRSADLHLAGAEDTFLLFAYDWRQDIVHSAQRLLELLERLRGIRGEEVLRVGLVCQSGGAQICRFLAKYGAAPLAEAEAGRAGPPARVEIQKLVLVGTSNGGSLRILRELDRGRRYIPLLGRRWLPETLFTFVSLFQDLPVYRRDLFLDEQGEPLEVDIFDPESWERYGWSAFGAASSRRIERSGRADLFGDRELRRRYLGRMLERSRRLHELLRRDVEGFATRYDSIQNISDETPQRAVLARRRGGGWKLLFGDDRELRGRPALRELATTRGDGHATVESQAWLSPQESRALVAEPLTVGGAHFEMILEPAVHRRLLDFLRD